MLNGKKTYILVALALVSGIALYAADVVANGFSMGGLVTFVNSEAAIAAIATLRASISKK